VGEGTRAYYFLQAFNTRPRYASCVTQGAQSALAIGSKRLYRLNPQTEETVSNEERTVVAIDDAVCTLALNPVKPRPVPGERLRIADGRAWYSTW